MKKCDLSSAFGLIHSYESLAALDGEGLRYGVFLSGCPLSCVYCHNPDTQGIPAGEAISAAALVKKIVRYRPYFGSNGGVTFSGGEPLCQAAFLRAVARGLEREGISYVLDTSGAVALSEDVTDLLSRASAVLLDLKFWDEESYRKYCGVSIAPVLKTLDYLEKIGKKVLLRTVIVPGINDQEKILEKYLAVISGYSCLSGYELLAFHTLGFFKYERLNRENPLKDVPPLSADRREALQAWLDQKMARFT